MKFYKFANGRVINIDLIKDKITTVTEITESYCGTYEFVIGLYGNSEFVSISFDDEILAKEQKDAFILYLEQNC